MASIASRIHRRVAAMAALRGSSSGIFRIRQRKIRKNTLGIAKEEK
jgi:hypothetical protein